MITLKNSKIRQQTKYAENFSVDKYEIFLGHLIEEIGEAREYVPRKEWKEPTFNFSTSNKDFEEYLLELVDIHLFLENTLLFTNHELLDFNFDFGKFYQEEWEECDLDFHMIVISMNDLIRSLIYDINFIDAADSFLRILEFSNVTPNTFLKFYTKKLDFNQVREDHILQK